MQPNQHTITVPMTDPDVTTKQLLVALIKEHLPDLRKDILMALDAAQAELSQAIATQMQQTLDALAKVQEGVDALDASEQEKAALQAALDEAVASNQRALDNTRAQIDVLASDDPAAEPEDPTEPGGEDPVDPPVEPGGEDPVDPGDTGEPTDPQAPAEP